RPSRCCFWAASSIWEIPSRAIILKLRHLDAIETEKRLMSRETTTKLARCLEHYGRQRRIYRHFTDTLRRSLPQPGPAASERVQQFIDSTEYHERQHYPTGMDYPIPFSGSPEPRR